MTKDEALSLEAHWNEMRASFGARQAALEAKGEPVACRACNGSGRIVRDPDIGTDQECFVCDGAGVPAAPVQEPVAWYRDENGIRIYYESKAWDDAIPLYTTPPQRTWVKLTDEQYLEACQMAEGGNYMVAFHRIQQWLMENNA
jgi:hypothetical protein